MPIISDKLSELSPLVNRLVDKTAHLMLDKSRSHQALANNYDAHDYVNHGIKEFVRGDAHVNTTESFGALLERTKQGVFHYLSKPHLPRYLDEISFRWNHRVPDKEIMKRGKKKLIFKPMPVMDMLSSLINNATGRQLRRTDNWGIYCPST